MGVGGRRGHQSYPSTTPAPIAYHRVPWYGKVAPITNQRFCQLFLCRSEAQQEGQHNGKDHLATNNLKLAGIVYPGCLVV